MSSGFVSAGTNEKPIERDDEWLKVQHELEEERRRKAEVGKQNDGKSLFEVLERNKMAKQEAFEEKSRLRNQFRSLDEDEVEFLDSVLESTRAQEAAVKRETAAQLEAFRRHREEAEKAQLDQSSSDANTEKIQGWTAPVRKRRRDQHRDLLFPGKKRKASVTENVPEKDTHNGQDLQTEGGDGQRTLKPSQTTPAVPATSSTTAIDPVIQPKVTPHVENGQKRIGPTKPDVSLGLGGYSSDSE